jgi:hypothetical protein
MHITISIVFIREEWKEESNFCELALDEILLGCSCSVYSVYLTAASSWSTEHDGGDGAG